MDAAAVKLCLIQPKRGVFAFIWLNKIFYSAKTIHFYTLLAGLNFLFSQNEVLQE